MKRYTVILLVIVLAFALTACGRRNETPVQTTPPVTTAPTEPATMPTIDPTMGTNIPDPEVDNNSTTDMSTPTDDTIQPETGTASNDENGDNSRAVPGRGIGSNRGMQFGE